MVKGYDLRFSQYATTWKQRSDSLKKAASSIGVGG
jgi:hypothetical protein